MSERQYSISVLIPTRGRTSALQRSIVSVFNRITGGKKPVQLIVGFDDDDKVGFEYFEKEIEPWLEGKKVDYTVMMFPRLGYTRLHEYYNAMAMESDSDWLFVWNDDALMETTGWNKIIESKDGEFKLLSVRTHRDHPNSIFPIMPRAWFDINKYLSPHQLIDTWVSQIGYFLDIFERTETYVTHDRYDLTGNNKDDTYAGRRSLEGNPSSPDDFNYPSWNSFRLQNTHEIADYLRKNGGDLTFWDNVLTGKQDPFEKMRQNDPNKMMNIHGTK
jgi:hypothetical protein